MGITTSFLIENDKAFRDGIDRLARTTSDFRIPFREIARDWVKSNRKIFTLASRGLYQDLAPEHGDPDAGGIRTHTNYIDRKRAEVGFAYPILLKFGDLARSLTVKGGPGQVLDVGQRTLTMGTEVEHAIYHQSDLPRKKIPQRKIIFIDGGPAERSKDAAIAGRRERWLNIINDHIIQLITGEVPRG